MENQRTRSDFADNGFAMDRGARIRLLAAHQDGRTRLLHPWRSFSRRHLAEKHDALLVSCPGLRRTLMGVLGEVSEDS
jgi:maleate cis-trans isomerase